MSDFQKNLAEHVELCREMAGLIRTRQPLQSGLNEIAQTKRGSVAVLAGKIADKLAAGVELSDALTQGGSRDSRTLAATIEAGYASNQLSSALDSWTSMHASLARFNKRLQTAIIYPAILICLMVISLSFTMWHLIPSYEATYESLLHRIPSWFWAVKLVHENLGWTIVTLTFLAWIPVLLWWRRRNQCDEFQIPRAVAQRSLLQAHLSELGAIMVDAGTPIERIGNCLWKASGTSRESPDMSLQSIPIDPFAQVCGRECALALAGLHAQLIPAKETGKLLHDISEQLRYRAEVSATREARWLPIFVSSVVGILIIVAYTMIIFLPWVILFKETAAPILWNVE